MDSNCEPGRIEGPVGFMHGAGDPAGFMHGAGDPAGFLHSGGDPAGFLRGGGDPAGFLRGGERAAYLLRGLYERSGYRKYRMAKFEEYDFYSGFRDFLPGGQILTFTDLNGKLMALKPDVTMSIVKRTRATADCPEKLYYNEAIYRPGGDAREFREISQIGLEYIGRVDANTEAGIVSLALKSLAAIGGRFILEVSHSGYMAGLLESFSAPAAVKREAARLLARKNKHGLAKLLADGGAGAEAERRLLALLSVADGAANAYGSHEDDKICGRAASTGLNKNNEHKQDSFADALEAAKRLVTNDRMAAAINELEALRAGLSEDLSYGALSLDLTLAHDDAYYNGLVMKGYIEGEPRAALSGGRYDTLLRRMGVPGLEAVGFAVYLDEIDFLNDEKSAAEAGADESQTLKNAEAGADERQTLKIALPKGRMGDAAHRLFEAAGFGFDEYFGDSRKLVLENKEARVSFLLVKPSDVAVYVERGAADAGVVGKDVLLETCPDVYELLDLQIGKCAVAVAGRAGYADENERALRVATKYPNITREFYAGKNRDIDVIKLNGSIELAPLLGLSDVIVDIVETGATLRENNLGVLETIGESSARFIANIISYKFKRRAFIRILDGLERRLTRGSGGCGG